MYTIFNFHVCKSRQSCLRFVSESLISARHSPNRSSSLQEGPQDKRQVTILSRQDISFSSQNIASPPRWWLFEGLMHSNLIARLPLLFYVRLALHEYSSVTVVATTPVLAVIQFRAIVRSRLPVRSPFSQGLLLRTKGHYVWDV